MATIPSPSHEIVDSHAEDTLMAWHWYIERPDELLIDLDRATPLRLARTRQRLEAGARKLRLRGAYLYPSQGEGFHLYLSLGRPPSEGYRAAWALWLGDDAVRRARILARWRTGRHPWSLLIEPYPLEGFYRDANYTCTCPAKHTPAVMVSCPVSQSVQGLADAGELFGLPDTTIKPWETFGRIY